jgi:hypothetical protein
VSWIRTIRKKPKHVRDNIAFGTSLGLTLVIAVGWFITGGSTHLADTSTKPDAGFFQTFKEGLNKQMAAAREALPKRAATSTATTTDRSNFQATPITTTSSSTGEQKPVLIEVVHASGTATTSSSSNSYY